MVDGIHRNKEGAELPSPGPMTAYRHHVSRNRSSCQLYLKDVWMVLTVCIVIEFEIDKIKELPTGGQPLKKKKKKKTENFQDQKNSLD